MTIAAGNRYIRFRVCHTKQTSGNKIPLIDAMGENLGACRRSHVCIDSMHRKYIETASVLLSAVFSKQDKRNKPANWCGSVVHV